MKKQTSLSTTDKKTMESYLATIRKAAEIEEYEMALTAMESLKQLIVEKLMLVHHGRKENDR